MRYQVNRPPQSADRVRSLRDKVASAYGLVIKLQGEVATASTEAVGSHATQWGGMVKISEPLINIVNESKPKVLRVPTRNHRLGPKGKGSRPGASNSPGADDAPRRRGGT